MLRWPQSPIKKLLYIFALWRLSLFLIGIVATFSLPFRHSFEYTRFTLFSNDTWIQHPLVEPWANFDGVHYLLIAKNGYANEARFFPIYPLSIRYLEFLTGISPKWVHADFVFIMVGLFISHLAFVVALLLLYKLLRLDFSAKIAFWSCLFLIIFPTSFFFVSVYAESLFLLLVVGAFWSARKRWWPLAAVCAAVASATRVVGIFLLPALILEYFLAVTDKSLSIKQKLGSEFKKIKPNILWLALAPLGLVLFAAFNYLKWGKWNYFLLQQADLGNSRSVTGFIDPVRVAIRYMRILTGVSFQHYEWWTALIELLSFLAGLGLLYFLWRKKIRFSYAVYALGCFFLPVVSGTLTGLPRYILIIFPFFLVMGIIRLRWLRYALLFVFSFLSVVLTMLFARGYFVG